MFTRPRIKASFRVEIVEPDAVFLLGEHRQHVFEGAHYVEVVRKLDGRRTMTEIATELSGAVDIAGIYGALAALGQKRCLAEGNGNTLSETAPFWDGLGLDAHRAEETLGGIRVDLIGVGEVDLKPLDEALAAVGIACGDPADLQVVVTDDYLRPALADCNREALTTGRPWMLVKPVGTIVWIGPLFRAGVSGCWECLAHRLRHNRQIESFVRRVAPDGGGTTSVATHPAAIRLAAMTAATELARRLAEEVDATGPDLITVDLLSWELVEHTLVRRPQCGACGQPFPPDAPVAIHPLELVSRPKIAGTDRGATAGETYKRYKHHISPITGAVTSMHSHGGDDATLVHNAIAGHYLPVRFDDVEHLRTNLLARSGGKGTTEVQAKTGALCEALERYAGIAWGEEPVVHGSYAALAPDAIHVRELSLFSDAQYDDRERHNREATNQRQKVPPRLDDDAPIDWVGAWSLTRGAVRYLPKAYCYYGHLDPGRFFTLCDSNGCAAGNTLEEAILHGLLELIERDSVALWWYPRTGRAAVDPQTFGLPYWGRMVAHYDEVLNRDLHVLDLTADLGVPTFTAVSRRRDAPTEDIIVGFGTDLVPAVALQRALIETNQYLPALGRNPADGTTVYRMQDPETVRWWKHATFENQPWLTPDPTLTVRTAADFTTTAADDILVDLQRCIAAVEARGLEVIVLDQTRPDIELPVARVVVPGLRHFWRRLAPGRLYDVPVAQGWVSTPMAEEDLNPISCFV